MNVNNIHNKTFHDSVTTTQMEIIRDLANYHEHVVFADDAVGGLGTFPVARSEIAMRY